MRENSAQDVQRHIAAMRRDIDRIRMARAVNRIAKEGSRAKAAMAKTAARASRTGRVAGDEVWEEALNLGADARKAAISGFRGGAEALRKRVGNPIGVLLVLAGIGLLSRRILRR
jgi:alkylhydroperoxidase family enzyme